MVTKFSTLRRGQAFMEMALGMFALALVLAATFGFLEYIISSLDMQRSLRAKAGRAALTAIGSDNSFVSASDSDTVTVEPLAAEYIFGSTEVPVKEAVYLPPMGGIAK